MRHDGVVRCNGDTEGHAESGMHGSGGADVLAGRWQDHGQAARRTQLAARFRPHQRARWPRARSHPLRGRTPARRLHPRGDVSEWSALGQWARRDGGGGGAGGTTARRCGLTASRLLPPPACRSSGAHPPLIPRGLVSCRSRRGRNGMAPNPNRWRCHIGADAKENWPQNGGLGVAAGRIIAQPQRKWPCVRGQLGTVRSLALWPCAEPWPQM